MALLFPMLSFRGRHFPGHVPPGVQQVSSLSHEVVNGLVGGLWLRAEWQWLPVLVLTAVLLVAGGIAVRNFRWE